MSVRTAALAILDHYRGALDATWDLRRYDVATVVRVWPAGTLPGAHGVAPVTTITPITVGAGNRPKVVQVTQGEVIASGGLYQDQDLKIGPLTPAYAGGGTVIPSFEPSAAGGVREVLFRLIGPGTAAGGDLYQKVGQSVVRSLGYELVVRRVGVYAP